MKDHPIKLSRVMAICLIVAVVTAGIVRATSPTQPFTINRGIYPGAPSFTIWEEDGTYFSKNNYGVVAYSGTEADAVIQSSIDAAEDGTVLVISPVTLTSGVSLQTNYETLIFDKEVTLDYAGPAITLGNTGTTKYYMTLKVPSINGQDAAAGKYGIYMTGAARCHVEFGHIGLMEIGIYLHGSGGAAADNTFIGTSITGCDVGIQMEGTSDSNHTQGNKFIYDYIGPNTVGIYVKAYSEFNTFIGTIDNEANTDINDDRGGNFYLGFVGDNVELSGYGSLIYNLNTLYLPMAEVETVTEGTYSRVVSFPFWNNGATDYIIVGTPNWETGWYISNKLAAGFWVNFTDVAPANAEFSYIRIDPSAKYIP